MACARSLRERKALDVDYDCLGGVFIVFHEKLIAIYHKYLAA